MANKEISKKQAQAYSAATSGLPVFARIALVLVVLVLLSSFLAWLGIYNTDMSGMEITVSGWSGAICALTGSYTMPNSVNGNMDTFYYFASEQCTSFAVLSLIALAVALVALAVEIIAVVKKKAYSLNCVVALLNCAVAVLIFLAFFAALSVKDSTILADYCSGNPACSIRSYAVIPALFAVAAAAVNCIGFFKYIRARKILK